MCARVSACVCACVFLSLSLSLFLSFSLSHFLSLSLAHSLCGTLSVYAYRKGPRAQSASPAASSRIPQP